jgi:hypothetical protein
VALTLVADAIDRATPDYLDFAANLLKYYWYRLSDAALPIGAAVALVAWIVGLRARRPRTAAWLLVAVTIVAGANLAVTNYAHRADLRPASRIQMTKEQNLSPEQAAYAFDQWRRACEWVARNTDPGVCFITPRPQQTFKWYAGRSEVCSWKDVPQNAVSVVEWWRRQQEVYPRPVVHRGLCAHGEEELTRLANKYGADFIIVDRNTSARPLLLPRVYPSDYEVTRPIYEIYRVPRAAP